MVILESFMIMSIGLVLLLEILEPFILDYRIALGSFERWLEVTKIGKS
jgi:hypothetical protein